MDTTSVLISWNGTGCNITNGTQRVYLYYQLSSAVASSQNLYEWNIRGVEMNRSMVNSLVVSDLEIAISYDAYLLYSLVGVGNGAPSKKLNFQTRYQRKC